MSAKFPNKNFSAAAAYAFLFFVSAFFLLEPEKAVGGVCDSLLLWAKNVLPVMLVFITASQYALFGREDNALNGGHTKAYLLYLTSLICAAPCSTAIIARMYEEGFFGAEKTMRLFALCSNMSPMFMYVTVGRLFFQSPYFGLALVLINFLSCLAVYGAMRFAERKHSEKPPAAKTNAKPTTARASSLKNAVDICLNIGGYMAFFGFITSALGTFFTSNTLLKAALFGLTEATSGLKLLYGFYSSQPSVCFVLACGICGFSGICICLQCASYIKQAGLNTKRFFICKLFTCAVSVCLALLFVFAGFS